MVIRQLRGAFPGVPSSARPHADCPSCCLQFPDDKVLSRMTIHLQLAFPHSQGLPPCPHPAPSSGTPAALPLLARSLSCTVPLPESPAASPDVPASFGLAKGLGCLVCPLWMPGVTILVTSQFSCWILAHQDTGVQARLRRIFLALI